MKPYYEDEFGLVRLFHGDSRVVLASLPAASVDSIVTDPPYELGFMGKGWDSTGVAYDPVLWSECLRVLKPGGHVLAFGGSRTWHRLASAIEDTGFEIRDSIAWMYGSGFPKSRDVSEAMALFLAGRAPEPLSGRDTSPEVYQVTSFLKAARDRAGWSNRRIDLLFGTNGMAGHWTSLASQPAVPSVAQWLVLKEKLEMGDEVDSLVELLGATEHGEDWGSGGSDEKFLSSLHGENESGEESSSDWGTTLKPAFEPIVVARKPPVSSVARNVAVWGTGALNIAGCRVGSLVHQLTRSDGVVVSENGSMSGANYGRVPGAVVEGRWPPNVVLDESQAEVLDAQTGVSVSRRQVVTSKPGSIYGGGKGLPAHTGEYGADDWGGASRFFPIFRYVPKAPQSERPNVDGVTHATVKPLALMQWLCRLVTPPGGTVLDPFTGSGTTLEAALIEGFSVVGVELEEAHLPLISQRLRKPMQQSLGDFDLGESA